MDKDVIGEVVQRSRLQTVHDNDVDQRDDGEYGVDLESILLNVFAITTYVAVNYR